jgi:hypothetical protein
MLQLPFFTGAITRATAQCARLINFDNRACGGVVHEVDKLLVPPTGSILQLIEKGDNYTLLRKIIEVIVMSNGFIKTTAKFRRFIFCTLSCDYFSLPGCLPLGRPTYVRIV